MNRLKFLFCATLFTVAACGPAPPSRGPAATPIARGSATPSTASRQATISPTPSARIGALRDGIPTTIDGAAVYVGLDAEQHATASTKEEPFLVGGWFHQGRPTVFCPAYLYGTRWGCNGWIPLYADATATESETIYPADPPNLTATDLYGSTRAVVVRVHTHDPACPVDFKGCELLRVEESAVWLGPALP